MGLQSERGGRSSWHALLYREQTSGYAKIQDLSPNHDPESLAVASERREGERSEKYEADAVRKEAEVRLDTRKAEGFERQAQAREARVRELWAQVLTDCGKRLS